MKVAEISGMGGREHGGYEWGCQVACLRALRFLQRAKESGQFPVHKTFENVTGIAIADNEPARKMDEFILDHPELKEFGMTGAMHQFAVGHAKARFEKGWEQYEKELREAGRTDEDFYEFNEADAFPEDIK